MSSPREQGWASIEILGVRVDCVDFQQTLDAVSGWIAQAQAEKRAKSREKTENTGPSADNRSEDANSGGQTHPSQPTRQVCTVNPEFIMTARRHPTFAQILAAADLCTPDGVGVLWAARRAGVRLNERVTGSDGIYRLCERAAAQGWRVFFLGAAPGIAERAAAELARLHPRQDIWIHQHREELPVAVALGIGGAFDFVAGITPRAPFWLRRLGLEWLYRLARQPWRWRRMAALPLFALLVLLQWARPRPANE
ncbi:MAG: WecB/TagA/CpsF family glycosyltransferase [Caldilineaceae bacterium SB0675_bin_29]|uniref:WecB/TagA/CpsF family glycosyltransferase n=1 Tax=Caldilineaceae bacterium SB0675_bin_29 TaxID=2605266 RepID=A0A6B1FXQ4_9CHLR|nr:WecB/TagA/CpsF family glycosyltransferase [Caldilineaceae bacterium SB0675_bin_29]